MKSREDEKRLLLSENARKMSEKLEVEQKLERELMTRIEKLEQKEHAIANAQQRTCNKEMKEMLEKQRREDELLDRNLRQLRKREEILLRKLSKQQQEKYDPYERLVERTTDANVMHGHGLYKPCSPKVPPFNGKHFEQWQMEVMCLL